MVAHKKGTVGWYLAREKYRATMKERYGDDFFKNIGSMGGKKSNPNKGFGSNRELARKAGAIGGKIGKRGKAKNV